MWKNRWRESLSRAQRLQPALWWSLGNASSKLWPCPALESRKWVRREGLWGGGQRRDTVKGALPYDLGFYCRVPGHLIFPPGQPRKPTLPGPGTNGLVMCLGRAEGFAEAPGNHEITVPHTHPHTQKNPNAIRHRWRWAEEKRMKEEGWGVTENGEDNQKGEKRKKVWSFFPPHDNKNGFKTVEVWRHGD